MKTPFIQLIPYSVFRQTGFIGQKRQASCFFVFIGRALTFPRFISLPIFRIVDSMLPRSEPKSSRLLSASEFVNEPSFFVLSGRYFP